jgi:hypothetical protein
MLHIVSNRNQSDGTLISDKKNYEKSRKITDYLEQKYGLHTKTTNGGGMATFTRSGGEEPPEKTIMGVVKPLVSMYKFKIAR